MSEGLCTSCTRFHLMPQMCPREPIFEITDLPAKCPLEHNKSVGDNSISFKEDDRATLVFIPY